MDNELLSLPAALLSQAARPGTAGWVALAGLLLAGALVLLVRSRARLALARAERAHAVEHTTLATRLEAEQARAAGLEARGAQDAARAQLAERTLNRLQAEHAALSERAARLPELTARLQQTERALELAREAVVRLESELAEEQKRSTEKLELLRAARSELTDQFKLLAQDILEDKSKRFTALNREQLDALLGPLGEQLQGFGRQVQEAYGQEARERCNLRQELERLAGLNSRLSDEALALTRALKGDSKTQGVWGELVLERVLESAGLRAGVEYEVQAARRRGDGSLAVPDVVVHLPGERHLVIDAKVSLTAYERYARADEQAERERAVRAHLQSLRDHVRALSARDYGALESLRSPELVLMFVPVEPAFILAAARDAQLFGEAFRQNVALVGPSTLMATLRMVSQLWRTEQQNRHAHRIAAAGGRLYDKFVAFGESLELIGRRLAQAREAHESALKQLSSGRGNLVRQAEGLRELGVQSPRRLPVSLRAGLETAAPAAQVGTDLSDSRGNPAAGTPPPGTAGPPGGADPGAASPAHRPDTLDALAAGTAPQGTATVPAEADPGAASPAHRPDTLDALAAGTAPQGTATVPAEADSGAASPAHRPSSQPCAAEQDRAGFGTRPW